MPLSADTLEKLILDGFPDAKVTITDLAGDNDHWSAEIISASFAGVSRINQHKMVYAALQGKMGGELHALQLKTSAPK
jgi:stress-induced morphogen